MGVLVAADCGCGIGVILKVHGRRGVGAGTPAIAFDIARLPSRTIAMAT
jgi:hypothetical protein